MPAAAQEEPDGYRVRSFVAAPSVTAATSYDSNLFRSSTRPTGTMKVTLAPELVVSSDWSRHAVKIELGAEAGLFTDSADDNYLDAHARLKGELDVTRDMRLSFSAGFARGHDPRSSDDLPAGVTGPVVFTELELRLGADARVGRFRISPFASFRQFDFGDVALAGGGTADQDVRDRREVEAGLELGFSTGRAWELLVRAAVFDIDYRASGSTAGPARDASGFMALAGVRVRLTDLLEGRVATGIARHDYAASALADVTTLALDTRLDWHPTRRLSVFLDAGREVTETAVTGAAGRLTTSAGIGADYELLRTLTIGAEGRFVLDDYRGIARTDRTFHLGIGADWSPMRGLSIRPEYTMDLRRSDAAGQGFTAHGVALTATYRFGAQQ